MVVASAGPAHAEAAQPLTATMQCERAAEPGRVRCSISARVEAGKTIAWSDAVIVSLPEFAAALKGRIGHEDATTREAAQVRWAFGLIARRAGQGEARARVRAVVCEASQPTRCAPITVDVHALVTVGG